MLETAKNIVQQYAVEEKIKFLKKVRDGELGREAAAKIIEDRRVSWIKNNIARLKEVYKDLSLPLAAHRIIYFEHMYIFPPDSVVFEMSPDFIIVRSYNFCPYLQACQTLGLDTRDICRHICQKPVEEMIKYIHPNLKFWRNYNKIRPHEEYCEEYISLENEIACPPIAALKALAGGLRPPPLARGGVLAMIIKNHEERKNSHY